MKKIICHIVWLGILVVLMPVGPALADDGVVERTDVCRKGTVIIKTDDDMYVAAYQAGMVSEDHSPWADNESQPCSFFTGERVNGDLSGYGTVMLRNSSGRECEYVIEGSGFSMQDAVQILGCE